MRDMEKKLRDAVTSVEAVAEMLEVLGGAYQLPLFIERAKVERKHAKELRDMLTGYLAFGETK